MNLNKENKDWRYLQPKNRRNDTSEPPRTRPGKEYPGGRSLRRSLKNLKLASGTQQTGKSADHGLSKVGAAGWTKPGSMKL